ncbi:MAG: hypothetical protein H6559_04840 [Lewinellaceae bacterium]|nr:hypothetical protein [Lewinellaceae bacterium]
MGQNFGTNGNVRFLDAETEGFSYCDVYPHSYIISWTPDTIILEVPGVALADKVPGSGLFRVVRSMPSLSTSVYSSEPIEIDYSLLNKEVTQDSFSHGHICKTHCDGITYSLHENLKLFESNIVVSLDSVFQELSNTIGLTINIDKDENGNYIYFDENIDLNTYTGDKNLIFATNNSSYLAAALPNFIFGSGSNDNSTLFINKKTLKIDTDENWEFSSTANVASGKVDFNATILHELGHVLGQNHALRIDSIAQGVDGSGLITYFHYVDRLKIMNPFSDTVFVPYSSRIRLSNDNTTLEMKRGLFDLMLLSSSVNMSDATKNNSHITKISETFQFNENNLTPNVGSTYINISIQGGKPPFFYQFYREGDTTSIVEDFTNINSINIVYNLSGITEPGFYCIKVKDANNCIAEECYYIERVECDIDYQLQEIVYPCQNEDGVGMISISPLGVNAPLFDIKWSDSEGNFYEGSHIEGLSPGIYYLTISDGFDCTLEDEFYLIETPPTILGSVQPACSENNQLGSVELNILGGVPPFSYAWNTGDTTQNLSDIDSSGIYSVTVTDACGNSETQSFDVGIFLSAPLGNYVQPPSSCNANNGDIVIASHGSYPQGGIPPYTYQWSTGQETANIYELGAGTYILTITDSEGCAQAFTFNLAPEGSPQIALVGEIMKSCEGEDNGAIEITFYIQNGGLSHYIVRWYNDSGELVSEQDIDNGFDSSISGLPPGNYTAIVEADEDNNPNTTGCSSSATFFVEERLSLGPFIATPQITPTCYGDNTGRIALNASGGNPPYTYNWDNGEHTQSIHSLPSPASYSVTVTDDCGRQIAHNNLFVPSYAEITHAIVSEGGCPGMIELETSGGTPPYNYLWSDGQTGAAAAGLVNGAAYQVTVSDANGCSVVQSFAVPVDEEDAFEILISSLAAPFTQNTTDGAVVVTTDPAGTYSYLWSNGAAGASVEGLSPGNYSVTATNTAGCSVARTVSLQSCYIFPGLIPNLPDFEILATGGLFSNAADGETTLSEKKFVPECLNFLPEKTGQATKFRTMCRTAFTICKQKPMA